MTSIRFRDLVFLNSFIWLNWIDFRWSLIKLFYTIVHLCVNCWNLLFLCNAVARMLTLGRCRTAYLAFWRPGCCHRCSPIQKLRCSDLFISEWTRYQHSYKLLRTRFHRRLRFSLSHQLIEQSRIAEFKPKTLCLVCVLGASLFAQLLILIGQLIN